MNDEDIKKDFDQIKQDILDDYDELDKSCSRNMLIELIFFLIGVLFLLIFLFGL